MKRITNRIKRALVAGAATIALMNGAEPAKEANAHGNIIYFQYSQGFPFYPFSGPFPYMFFPFYYPRHILYPSFIYNQQASAAPVRVSRGTGQDRRRIRDSAADFYAGLPSARSPEKAESELGKREAPEPERLRGAATPATQYTAFIRYAQKGLVCPNQFDDVAIDLYTPLLRIVKELTVGRTNLVPYDTGNNKIGIRDANNNDQIVAEIGLAKYGSSMKTEEFVRQLLSDIKNTDKIDQGALSRAEGLLAFEYGTFSCTSRGSQRGLTFREKPRVPYTTRP